MNRYCSKCDKEYDFDPVQVSKSLALKCPECGSAITVNSRRPVDRTETLRMEANIGRGIHSLFRFSYIFYLFVATIGLVCFALRLDKPLYYVTGFILAVYFLQLLSRMVVFPSGRYFLPMGAALGFMYFKSIQGACFGIHVVFFLRHIIRDIFWRFIGQLVKWGNMR